MSLAAFKRKKILRSVIAISIKKKKNTIKFLGRKKIPFEFKFHRRKLLIF
jgi:hypothetical protein